MWQANLSACSIELVQLTTSLVSLCGRVCTPSSGVRMPSPCTWVPRTTTFASLVCQRWPGMEMNSFDI